MGLTRPRAHQLQDIDYKQTARAVTVANVTLSGGAPATVDGTSLALRDRVLVTAQTTGSENGIYYVTTVGAGSNGTWARSLDANETGEIKAGTIIMITEGTTYADTQWKLTTDDPITVGSTTMTFVRAGNAAYGTIAVAGQNSIVADQIGDTLTMVAGTNLALTTNDGTDTLTITPSLTPAITSLTATGNIAAGNLAVTGLGAFSGNVTIPDTKQLQLGTDADFSLQHDGTNSIIRSGSHRTWIQTDSILEITKNNAAEYMARFIADGAVQLRHNNTTRFETTSTGATITGNLNAIGGGISSTTDIVIDSTSSDHDIIFKGNDGGSDITALTLDMSIGGVGIFNSGVQAGSYFWGAKTDDSIFLYAGANFEIRATHVHNTGLLLTNSGTGTPAVELQFVDANESIGSNGSNLLLTSGGSEITVPASAGNMVVDSATQTLTNKTLTSPTINAFSGTGNGSITGTLSIVTTTTDDSLLITTTEDSSSAGPVLTLKRNSASPADADYLGQLKFKGENDADQEVVYAKITGKIQDASDGSEDGIIEFANRKAGSNNINMRLRSDSLQLINGTNLTVAGTSTLTGNVSIEDASSLLLYDTDSSNYIGFKAPGTVTTNVTYTLPADGSSGQVLQTNGSGTLSFVDQSGGGEGGSSFPNCTVTPLPSSEGNFDLAKQFDQTGSAETPFESGATDAFGVSLGQIYTMMDPVGSTLSPTDLGVLS